MHILLRAAKFVILFKLLLIHSNGLIAKNWKDTLLIQKIVPNERTRTIDVDITVIQEGRLKPSLTNNAFSIREIFLEDTSNVEILRLIPLDSISQSENIDEIESSTLLPVNYRLRLRPNQIAYKGREHQLQINSSARRADLDFHSESSFRFGSPSNAINFSQFQWKEVIFLGLIILAVLLTFFSQLIPYLRERKFKKEYVKPYRDLKQANVTHRDPITAQVLKDDEEVVHKCRTLTSYDTWRHNHFQCVNYPGCLYDDPPCKSGEASQVDYLFFKQGNFFKQLNWIWFGGLGGLLAWGLWAILKNIDFTLLSNALAYVVQSLPIDAAYDSLVYALTKDVFMGLCLGLSLGFALAWVEELGQSRKVSWLRIIFRSLLAMLVTPLFFIVGFFLQHGLIQQEFLSGLVSWALFGTFLGLVLSVRSTIGAGRGMLGGLIASIVAFNVYHWISHFSNAFELAKMLSFILLGMLLGYIIVTVVSRLEDFELEYVSPEKFRRSNPLGRWLKQKGQVFIGRDASCFVFVKWEDPEVAGRHARLFYNNGTVHLEALADTIVNQKLLQKGSRVSLKNGDMIQLGQGSISRMCFWEKSSGKASTNTYVPDTGASSNYQGGDEPHVKQRPKPNIRIKRRG